jgi:hypothetical protein
MRMDGWTVHDDGSFSLTSGGIRLQGCYPACDGQALHPLQVEIERSESSLAVRYDLPGGGTLSVQFLHDQEGFRLRTILRGRERAPHWLSPLGSAQIQGADQFFKQGLGFGGPSGFRSLRPGGEPYAWESYGLTGFTSVDEHCLAIAPRDHQRFLFKAVLQKQLTRRGLVDRHLASDEHCLSCGFSLEGVGIVGGELVLPDIHLVAGSRPWETFRALAGTIAERMGARAPTKPSYRYCSWYRRGCHFDRADLDRLLGWLVTADPHVPLQTVQIDDGYCASPGDWLEAHAQWPGGLEAAFAAITSAGYRPGIWIAPFMVGSRSLLFQEHPDWVLRNLDGSLVVEWRNYGNSAIAAHHDEETYALDTSHPGAMGYLRSVLRTLRGWGCRFFKTDFMDWGFKDSLTVRRHVPGKSSTEYFRDVLAMIRQEIGEDSYWLGCIMPFAPSIGAVDGMRIANDVGPEWSEGSTGNMIQESSADQYFNNIWWQNDCDAVLLRSRFSSLEPQEVKALAYWQGVLGVSISTSEFFQELASERLNLWYFLEPDENPWTAAMPRWHRQGPLKIAAREFRGLDAWAVVVLNPTSETQTISIPMDQVIGAEAAYVFSWEPGRAKRLGKYTSLVSEVPSHQAQLYFVSLWGEPPPPDLSLGGKLLSYWLIGSSAT